MTSEKISRAREENRSALLCEKFDDSQSQKGGGSLRRCGWACLAVAVLWMVLLIEMANWSAWAGKDDALSIEFWSNLGQASGGPIGLAGFGAIVLSFVSLKQQLREQEVANKQRSMPTVFVQPRLIWVPTCVRLSGDGPPKVEARELCLEFVVYNVGDSAALELELYLDSFVTEFGQGSIDCRACLDDPDDYLEFVLPQKETSELPSETICARIQLMSAGTVVCDPGERTGKFSSWPGLLGSILANWPPEKETWRIEIAFRVSLKSISNQEFRAAGRATWSGKACRRAGDFHQFQILDDWKAALENARKDNEQDRRYESIDNLVKNPPDHPPLYPLVEEINFTLRVPTPLPIAGSLGISTTPISCPHSK